MAYFLFVIGMTGLGILTLALQNCRQAVWERGKRTLSLVFSVLGTLLFIVSLQPYAAALLFLFLAIKVLMLIKKQ